MAKRIFRIAAMQDWKFSKWVFLICILALTIARLLKPGWDTMSTQAVISWDVMGYYLYLPSWFIYNDITSLSFVPNIIDVYHPTESFYQAILLENGNYVMKYPIGMAILYLPLFLLAHFASFLFGYPMDGFSTFYQMSIGGGSIVYAILGIWFLRKCLLYYFNDTQASLTLLVLVLGTNYFQYASLDAALTHNYLFSLYAIILYCTIKWHEKQTTGHAVLIGSLSGLAILIRPSELIVLIIPLLWGVYNWETLKSRLRTLWKRKSQIILSGICLVIIVSIQLIYWKIVSGNYLVYTYEDQGFSFLHPHLKSVLFSFRKGWLIYTPMMIFAIIGFWFLYQKNKPLMVSILLFFSVNLYIVSSWDVWWYGGSFGQRALVQSYVFMAFPLAAFINWAIRKKRIVALTGGVMAFFIFLNLFQTWQYHNGILPDDNITRSYYQASFLKSRITEKDIWMLDVKEIIEDDALYEQIFVWQTGFEDSLIEQSDTLKRNGSRSVIVKPNYPFSPGYKDKIDILKAKKGDWIRAKIWLHDPTMGGYGSKLVVSFEDNGKPFKWEGLTMRNRFSKSGKWRQIVLDVRIPESYKETDEVQVYVWNQTQETIWVDDLEIWLLSKK